jgi:two-component system NarL family sensor kinase
MDNGELKITVADNGHGIAASAPQARGHDGLGNIRQRIEDLGGRFELASDAATGTTLRLHLPLGVSRKTRKS